MSNTFIENFMLAAQKVSHAERCLVVDPQLQLLNTLNVSDKELQSAEFNNLAMECLRQAWESGEALITNNVIPDPSDAPTTNTNFANLRVIVALPIVGHGAIYMDQHIRNGIIPKQMVDQLMRLAEILMQKHQEALSVSEMVQQYQALPK